MDRREPNKRHGAATRYALRWYRHESVGLSGEVRVFFGGPVARRATRCEMHGMRARVHAECLNDATYEPPAARVADDGWLERAWVGRRRMEVGALIRP